MKADEIDSFSALLRARAPIAGAEIEAFARCLRDNGWCDNYRGRAYMAIAADLVDMLSARRDLLPQRRAGEGFDFEFEGQSFVATVGRYPDGRIGEIFVNGQKLDTALDIYARDLGMAISIALQYGATVDGLAKTMTRDAAGKPQGLGGYVLDLVGAMR